MISKLFQQGRNRNNGNILHAIRTGRLEVDADSGRIWLDGEERGIKPEYSGYCRIRLEGFSVLAHRVMWMAIYGDIPNDLELDHINRNRADNRISNLRLVTRQGNALNRRNYKGSGNPNCKLRANDVIAIQRCIAAKVKHVDIAKMFGISWQRVWQLKTANPSDYA